MAKLISFPLLSVVFLASMVLAAQAPTSQSPIWKWTTPLHAEQFVDASVEVDGKQIWRGSIPVCHHQREANCPAAQNEEITFSVELQRKRGRSFRSVNHGLLECSLWPAGGDDDGFTLGVGLSNRVKIALNYLYDVHFGIRQVETIAPGFTIRTAWSKATP